VLPPLAFLITRRWCISLQRQDREKLLHGYETGVIMRSPEGGYSERHLPLSADAAYVLTAGTRDEVYVAPDGEDGNGVAAPRALNNKARARVSRFWFGDNVPRPTRAELEEAQSHLQHDLGHTDGHGAVGVGGRHHQADGNESEIFATPSADGHQFDGRHEVAKEHLRED
jgi:ubiquinol-cytochrome c reductase cytochrome b subunit